jgi:hypothetical protein
MRTGGCFMLPKRVASWDFDAPVSGSLSRLQVDTSASAIAAVGLFNLAGILRVLPVIKPIWIVLLRPLTH